MNSYRSRITARIARMRAELAAEPLVTAAAAPAGGGATNPSAVPSPAFARAPVSSVVGLPRALSLPPAVVRRRWSPYLIWLVPALVVLLGVGAVMRTLAQRGPTVTITFAAAEGLEAHKTTIRYKGVVVGSIKSIDLRDDRSGVVVTAELSRPMTAMMVDDARFWVVRPRVSAAGVSGMGTLLTGAHLAFDAGVSSNSRRAFVGLEAAPSTISDRRGSRFTLRAENVGSLDVGTPVYLRRFQVGQVTRVALDADGGAVNLDVFVDAPYDAHVTTNTRFWNVSGVDLTVDTGGIKLDTQSLASMLMGGIAFQTVTEGGGSGTAHLVSPGTIFAMHPDRKTALRASASSANRHRLVFNHPVRGLIAGAPVTLSGLEVGEVLRVDVDFDATTTRPRTVVTINLHPERIRVRQPGQVEGDEGSATDESLALFRRMVEGGLRAQVRSGNLLTGQRYVAFEWATRSRPVAVDWSAQPVELPTWAQGSGAGAGTADPEDLPQAVARLVAKAEKMIDGLPLQQLAREGTETAREMRRTLEQTSAVMTLVNKDLAPRMVALLGQTEKTLASAERTLASDAPLQQDLRGALRDLSGAGQALRAMAESLERHPESILRGKRRDPQGSEKVR